MFDATLCHVICSGDIANSHRDRLCCATKCVFSMTEIIADVHVVDLLDGEVHHVFVDFVFNGGVGDVVFAALDYWFSFFVVAPEHHFWFGVGVDFAFKGDGIADGGHGDATGLNVRDICKKSNPCIKAVFILSKLKTAYGSVISLKLRWFECSSTWK